MTHPAAALCLRVALVALASSAVIALARAPEAGAAPCAYAPASVAVVVDFGDGSTVSAVCVPAASTDNGAAVLAARAEQLGTPAPRFNSSGLLCAIDGNPSDGCGEQNGSRYAYWSYWHGTGAGWSYSNVGPGGSRVHAGETEGWRFQPDGAGNPSDPAPRGNPDPAATCAPPASTASTASAESAAVAPSSIGSAQSSDAASNSSSRTTTTTGSTAATGTTAATAVSRSATTARPTGSTIERAAGSMRVTDQRSSTPVLGWIAGSAVIGALVVGGVIVTRRRAGGM
jgi:hypothetical protein